MYNYNNCEKSPTIPYNINNINIYENMYFLQRQ